MMRVLITGSRGWTHRAVVEGVLDHWQAVACGVGRRYQQGPLVIVHGACPRGADAHADRWATRHGVQVERHPADWQRYGPRSGFVRNAEMVAAGADLCLAFILPCDKLTCPRRGQHDSHGTDHCAGLARAAGIEVLEERSDW